MTILIVCIRRKPGMSFEAFDTYWRQQHAPLLRACGDFTRHLIRYEQYHVQDRDSPVARMFGVTSNYDGVALLEFADADAMQAAFAEPAYLEQVRPDEPNFVDLENSLPFIVERHAVLGTS
ncbi:EthD domain-containing protein [Novosphingobium sp. KCTC 2891]|uniref:EthD domain-containing protein n=1 Tax=Novosphingobium sp. KCTC 2891 TaxID=2989730 RepID=UPI0022212E1E|nr:EthD domain-containing protein [Novosphingobium sp. KCTC 2891]MCW1383767.1 EthD domain-containing protein [Novosphingobium sp. KCTC 2891]